MSKRNTAYVPRFKTEREPGFYRVLLHLCGSPLEPLGKLDKITRIAPGGESYVDVPDSIAFLCPACGSFWARLAFSPNNIVGSSTQWTSLDRPCKKCGDGSIEPYLGGRHDEILQLFSYDLWCRELEIEWASPDTQEFLKQNGIN